MGRSSRFAAVGMGISWMAWAGAAVASSGLDSPDSGVVQGGRGSAWLARADDPMAVYFNPAAMAFQPTSVHLGAQMLFLNRCYTRTAIDPTTGKEVTVLPDSTTTVPAPLLPGQAQPTDGSKLPSGTVCAAGAFPTPQVGAVFRIADRWAIGLALVAPHAVGKADWGESLPYTGSFNGSTYDGTMPSPQRYLITYSDAIILNPTISVAFAPLDNLSFGAGFIWGIASAHFTNFAEVMSPKLPSDVATDQALVDLKADFKAKDLFVPGFVLSTLWSPTSNLDVAAWFKWQDAIKGSGELYGESVYWDKPSLKHDPDICGTYGVAAGCNVTQAPGPGAMKDKGGSMKLNIPMEAKLGLRYHMLRSSKGEQVEAGAAQADASKKPSRRVRDPLAEDLFDVELDFTWANNSAVKDLEVTFSSGIPINFPGSGALGSVPVNSNVPHHWRDVFGVRLGGDYVVLPRRLALRAGGFFETKGQDDRYLNIDFDLAWRAGVSGGATVRLGPVDISVMYGHTFFGTLDNHGDGALHAISGDPNGPVVGDSTGACTDVAPPAGSKACLRSWQAINGGRLTASLNEFGLAATGRF